MSEIRRDCKRSSTDIEFRTEDDVILRGWHYLPDRAGPTPTVVMAHGYSAVKEMYLNRFAEAFAEPGIMGGWFAITRIRIRYSDNARCPA